MIATRGHEGSKLDKDKSCLFGAPHSANFQTPPDSLLEKRRVGSQIPCRRQGGKERCKGRGRAALSLLRSSCRKSTKGFLKSFQIVLTGLIRVLDGLRVLHGGSFQGGPSKVFNIKQLYKVNGKQEQHGRPEATARKPLTVALSST